MTNLSELKRNLDTFKKSGTINSAVYASLTASVKGLETELGSAEKEASVSRENLDKLLGEKLTLEREKLALSAQVEKLAAENASLESRLSGLLKTRPALSSANLVNAFKVSLDEMDSGLKAAPSGVKYQVSSLNVSLKTNLALEGEELRFQMPGTGDLTLPENLSTIEFSLKAVSQKAGLASYREVPDLVGLLLETAGGELLEAGFKVGEVRKKESSAPIGTVIAQLPSAGALAAPGAAVDLILSGASPVEVPDLVGLELESAKQALENAGFQLGGTTERVSEEKAGTVLSQNPAAGSMAEPGSSLDLIVSTDVLSVPNLLGLELESARQVLEKSLLQAGGIKEQTSEGKAGIVLAQAPKAGEEAKINSKVLLTVSVEAKTDSPEVIVPEKPKRVFPETIVKASSKTAVKASAGNSGKEAASQASKPESRTVPNVCSLVLENAISVLEGEGLKVGKVSELLTRAREGTVISQSPKAGTIANPLIPVDLVASKKRALDKSSASGASALPR